MQESGNTIREALNTATQALKAAGIDQARLDAGSLLMQALNVNRTFVVTHSDQQLTPEQFERFQEYVTRRAAREPLQYITGAQDFFKLEFEVTPGVLIPRPETELTVEAALELVNHEQPISILDVGTGSGCIVISLLSELRNAQAVAIDISPDALEVAERNARRHDVSDRLTLIQGDGLSPLDPSAAFSLIVSNPPYVPAGDIETLPPEVRDYEPLSALVSGADGLDHIRTLLHGAALLLRRSGYFIFEIGFGQREAVEQLIDQTIWRLIEVKKDLQEIPRTVVLQKR